MQCARESLNTSYRYGGVISKMVTANEVLEMIPIYEMADTADWTKSGYSPKKTIKAYKLFKEKSGQLYPLFISASTATPMHTWLTAEFIPTKGYAERPGWHAGILPIAPHLRQKSTGKINTNRVWAEVELAADREWQSVANKSSKKDIRGQIPERGYYEFATSKMQGKKWFISGALRVNKILSDEEVTTILSKGGYSQADIDGEMHT